MEQLLLAKFEYYLDKSDPDIVILRRQDGAFVAAFSARGATREAIVEAAKEDYERLRYEGMGIEQAMIFVGHRFRMWHLRHLPVGEAEGRDPDRTKPYGRADARKVRLLPRRV